MQDLRTSHHGMISSSAIANDCRDLIALAAGERGWNDTRESWLGRGARRLGIAYSRAYNIFYGRSKRIEAAEYLGILFAAQKIGAINARNKEIAAEVSRTLAQLDGSEAHDDQLLAPRPQQANC